MTLTILVALSGWVVQIVDVSTLSHTAYLMVKTACWAVHTASGGTHSILLEWTCASTVLPPFPRCPPPFHPAAPLPIAHTGLELHPGLHARIQARLSCRPGGSPGLASLQVGSRGPDPDPNPNPDPNS